MNHRHKISLLLTLSLLGVFILIVRPPIPQPVTYHNFADQRTLLGIPNFGDVMSNLPLGLVGLYGLYALLVRKKLTLDPELQTAYVVFFSGIFTVCFCSAYYHLNPNNATLVWDRLPITVAFMAFFATVIGEHFGVRAGRRFLWPLVLYGLLSVGYWHWSETAGRGDMRPYLLVQILPILLIPLIIGLLPARFTRRGDIFLVLGLYVVAKGLEFADASVFASTGFISGHSLKHIFAAWGAQIVTHMLAHRQKLL